MSCYEVPQIWKGAQSRPVSNTGRIYQYARFIAIPRSHCTARVINVLKSAVITLGAISTAPVGGIANTWSPRSAFRPPNLQAHRLVMRAAIIRGTEIVQIMNNIRGVWALNILICARKLWPVVTCNTWRCYAITCTRD